MILKTNDIRKLVKFLAQHYAEQEVWISEEHSEKKCDGYTFVPMPHVKGVVVFGQMYPLSRIDLPIDQHLQIFDSITMVCGYSEGVVVDSGNHKMYQSRSGDLLLYPVK